MRRDIFNWCSIKQPKSQRAAAAAAASRSSGPPLYTLYHVKWTLMCLSLIRHPINCALMSVLSGCYFSIYVYTISASYQSLSFLHQSCQNTLNISFSLALPSSSCLAFFLQLFCINRLKFLVRETWNNDFILSWQKEI